MTMSTEWLEAFKALIEATRSQPPTTPTVPELETLATFITTALRDRFGARSSAILMIGVPCDDGHDHFVHGMYGPCLTTRGLLAWGERQVRERIDRGDSSRNGGIEP
jgi:hypothetical protein